MKLIQESPARVSVRRRAGRKMRAQRQEGSLFRPFHKKVVYLQIDKPNKYINTNLINI